jgi:hypothetical protein
VQYALLSINVSCRYQPKLVTNLGDVRFGDVRFSTVDDDLLKYPGVTDVAPIRQISIRPGWRARGSHIARSAL